MEGNMDLLFRTGLGAIAAAAVMTCLLAYAAKREKSDSLDSDPWRKAILDHQKIVKARLML